MCSRPISVFVLLAAVVLPVASEQRVFRRDLLVGDWKVNWQKSNLQNPPPTSGFPSIYRQYEAEGDGYMLHTRILIDPSQAHTQLLLAVVRYDGREYPTYTSKRLADRLLTGTQAAQTVTFKVMDDYAMEWADKTNGKLTGTGTVALSRDGKTMTETSKAFDAEGRQTGTAVLTYEKR